MNYTFPSGGFVFWVELRAGTDSMALFNRAMERRISITPGVLFSSAPLTGETMQAFSLLDLAPITEGGSARQALLNARDLARHVERIGYSRFWMAEHHNMPGIASAATPVALGFVAAGTERIRVGAAGIMLPNHAPLVVAEQFGTLACLYPDRIDLGLGRAPGTDQETLRALRREHLTAANQFPRDVQELLHYLEPAQAGQRVQAVPGAGTRVPVWILGSSLFVERTGIDELILTGHVYDHEARKRSFTIAAEALQATSSQAVQSGADN